MRMKIPAILLLTLTLAYAAASGDITVTPDSVRSALTGNWRHFDVTYEFAPDGVMTMHLERDGDTRSRRFNYRLFRMGINDFCEYRDHGRGAQGQGLLFIDEISDTSAVIAIGTPFLKTDETSGMLGTWKNVNMYRTLTLTLNPENMSYRETVFDPVTKTDTVVEQRSGTYYRMKGTTDDEGVMLSGGRYIVHFADGSFATLLPVVHNDRMYLFDLSPQKSVFERVPPSGKSSGQPDNPS